MTTRTDILRRTAPRRGFTLVELMVAVLVGSIVIVGVYTIYSVSVRGYRVQDQALEAHGQLRRAAQQLKADLRSAAFNAPAHSDAESWVRALGTTTLTAVAIEDDPTLPVAFPATNQNIAPQRIRLLGDFDSQRTYRTVAIAGSLVTLEWPPEAGDQADFERIFSSDNFMRLEFYGAARTEQVIPIASNNWNGGINPQVTLSQSVQNMIGFGSGHEVSAISFVRYRLVRDTRRDPDSVKWDLVREKLQPNGNPVDGSWLIVAEYVVDLQFYDFCLNTADPQPGTMIQSPVRLECYATLQELMASGWTLAPGTDNASHLLRSMKFKVSVRTPYEDPEVPFAPRASRDEPLRTFDINTDFVGAARVTETAGAVFMTSIQARRQ